MRINCHSHVFNLQSVFSSQSKQQLEDRLAGAKVPKPIRKIIVNLAVAVISRKREIFVGDELHMDKGLLGLKGMADSRSNDLRDALNELKRLNEKRWQGYRNFRSTVMRLRPSELDFRYSEPTDWLDFLHVSFSPVDDITDKLLKGMAPDDITVALMIEYYGDPHTADPSEMDELYQWQIEDTLRQTWRHPGRVLPFLGVDTRRPDFKDYMHRHLGDGSCVGVKIYPSAGFPVNDHKMDDVLRICEDHEAPLLMHCNRGGFSLASAVENANPGHWWKLLKEHPTLRVCFGHFGGDDFISGAFRRKKPKYTKTPWHTEILSLMKETDNVYADLSYHSLLRDSSYGAQYRAAINAILHQEGFTDNILWGTDYTLILLAMQDTSYTREFQEFLDGFFDTLSRRSPLRYLGLDPEFVRARHKKNMDRHIDWLEQNLDNIRRHRSPMSQPAPWLPESLRKAILE